MGYYVDFRQEYFDWPIEVVSTNIEGRYLLALAKYHAMQMVKENPPINNIVINLTLEG